MIRNKYFEIRKKSEIGRCPSLPKKISSEDHKEKRMEKEQSGSRNPKFLINYLSGNLRPRFSKFCVPQPITCPWHKIYLLFPTSVPVLGWSLFFNYLLVYSLPYTILVMFPLRSIAFPQLFVMLGMAGCYGRLMLMGRLSSLFYYICILVVASFMVQ